MQCPIDGAQLVMTERAGVEIDYCPQCRGVWLDRGELDKIIERSAVPEAPQPAPRQEYREERRDSGYDSRGYDDRRDSRGYGDSKYYKRRKQKSFLSEIFDFD